MTWYNDSMETVVLNGPCPICGLPDGFHRDEPVGEYEGHRHARDTIRPSHFLPKKEKRNGRTE